MKQELEWRRFLEDNKDKIEFGFEVTLVGPGKSFEKEIEKEKLHKLEMNERQKNAIEYLKRGKAITRQIYCQINNIGDTYAKKELKELIQKKIIRRIGKGRSTCYTLVSD